MSMVWFILLVVNLALFVSQIHQEDWAWATFSIICAAVSVIGLLTTGGVD